MTEPGESKGILSALPQPVLRDPTGRIVIGPPNSPSTDMLVANGATHILYGPDGEFIGAYIDDTAPNPDEIAAVLVKLIPGKLIVVALGQGQYAGHRVPGCLCAYEWYPYQGTGSDNSLGMPFRWAMGLKRGQPAPQAWILQWDFAWNTDRQYPPPTKFQRWRLLTWVRLRYPRAKLILTY